MVGLRLFRQCLFRGVQWMRRGLGKLDPSFERDHLATLARWFESTSFGW